ncbi:hypothetical protein BDW22DRAFT_1379022 [Trametopsis cervina]|nr:hypothetical protein BDW22DRAFT_1379022 [Trametopsis cervina]
MEHCFIGDAIKLTLANGSRVAASDHKFTLPNGLSLTYGQINGLSGDFYGTSNPISDGANDQDRSMRFVTAYNTLANDSSRQPREAMDILKVLQAEVDAVNEALRNHQDPSVAYSKLPDVGPKLEQITVGRSGIPGYLGLAMINWDHFGQDARTVYNTGHALAISRAVSGDLEGAYAINAFADHFLEDSFSAGHLRTPRRILHKPLPDLSADACAKLMHDEDSAIGFWVSDVKGETWHCYGDKRALDTENADNLKRCVAAVQASADEVYKAYHSKTAPPPSKYEVWKIAPTLESAHGMNKTLATLFTFDAGRRQKITDRKQWQFTRNWTFWSTWLECQRSGYWKYPITIDGHRPIIPWSSVAVTAPKSSSLRLFYQAPSCEIFQSTQVDGKWTNEIEEPVARAVRFTPLASINWDAGKEVRLYFLDTDHKLQEYCYSEDRGSWYLGELGQLNVQASQKTSISAIACRDDKGGVQIRVYCQESGSIKIREFTHDGCWRRSAILPDALDGSSISAVTYRFQNQLQIRVYYQSEDLTIMEHCLNNSGWFKGEMPPEKAPGCTPISALGYSLTDGGCHLHVYWIDVKKRIVGTKNVGYPGWQPMQVAVTGLKSGSHFALLEWETGKHLRLFYQTAQSGNSLTESSNDGDDKWSESDVQVDLVTK